MTTQKKKGPEYDGAKKMREFYNSVIQKPLNKEQKEKLKETFGKKKDEEKKVALEIKNTEVSL